MAAPSLTNELEVQIEEVGNMLVRPPSTVMELLDLLDKAEDLLSYVEQVPPRSMQAALLPSMGALISDDLLRHSDVDVKISVASCISEITRITAPDTPYNDDIMKKIFELNVMAFGKLSNVSGHCYSKAFHILDSTASVQSCMLMLDLEFDDLIVEMFQQFLSTIRSTHPHAVFSNMEKIMTLVIEQSDEVSVELLRVLLSSVKKENQDVAPISWKLGEKILNNCAVILKEYLPGAMQSMDLDPDNYADVVASICKGAQRMEAESLSIDFHSPGENGHSVNGVFESATENFMEHESRIYTLRSCHQTELQTSTAQRSLSQKEAEKRERGTEMPPKKGRRRNSKLRGYLIRDETEFEVHNQENGDGAILFLGDTHGAHSVEVASLSSDGALREKSRGSKTKVTKGLRETEVAKRTRVQRIHAPTDTVVKEEEGIFTDAEGTAGPSPGKFNDRKRKRGKTTSSQKLVSSSATTSRKSDRNRLSEASKEKLATPQEQAHKNEYGEELVGHRIKVWWPLDQKFYDGVVAAFDPSEKKHTVLYADGDQEILNLHDEHWEVLKDLSPNRGPVSSYDKQRKKKGKWKTEFVVKAEPVDLDESTNGTEVGGSDGGLKPTNMPQTEKYRTIMKPKLVRDSHISSPNEDDPILSQKELGDSAEAEESEKI